MIARSWMSLAMLLVSWAKGLKRSCCLVTLTLYLATSTSKCVMACYMGAVQWMPRDRWRLLWRLRSMPDHNPGCRYPAVGPGEKEPPAPKDRLTRPPQTHPPYTATRSPGHGVR